MPRLNPGATQEYWSLLFKTHCMMAKLGALSVNPQPPLTSPVTLSKAPDLSFSARMSLPLKQRWRQGLLHRTKYENGMKALSKVPGRWKVLAENGSDKKCKTCQQVNSVQRPHVCTVATKPEPQYVFIETLSPTEMPGHMPAKSLGCRCL